MSPEEERRLETLRSLAVLDTSPEERFDRLTRMAKRLFGVPIALVSLVDDKRQWFKSCQGLTLRETPRDHSFCGHAILGDDVFVIPDAAADRRFANHPLVLGDPRIRFYAGCPLKALNGERIGTLCIIDRKPRQLGAEDRQALRDLASMAERELAAVQLATLDELTGISNRRGFMILGQYSLRLCVRQGMPAALVFLDLDGFKAINDAFGHAEGDRALKEFSDHLRSTYRDSDIFARLGGDEFAVLLASATKAAAQETVERLAAEVARTQGDAHRDYSVSFSHGVVEFDPASPRTLEELLAAGDALMYGLKNAKREP